MLLLFISFCVLNKYYEGIFLALAYDILFAVPSGSVLALYSVTVGALVTFVIIEYVRSRLLFS